jgi:hypothetical protein
MSKLLISTGTNPNDGNGDTLLAGAGKVNSNFNEIYSSLGNGTDLNIGVAKTVISTDSLGNVGVGTTNPTSKLTVKGNTSLETLSVTGVSTFTSNVGIGTTNPTSSLYVVGNALISGISTVGLGTTSSPQNSQLTFELISNTKLRIKVRGTDGTIRFSDITLAP